MFDELWSEIQDSQGEIFDVIEYKEEWEKEEKVRCRTIHQRQH